MERIFCILIGYAFGLFQTAFILGKMKGIDINEVPEPNGALKR